MIGYKERVAYDPNGNILKYLRNSSNSGSTIGMDSLNYQYFAGTNRLQRIRDNVPATQAANYDDLGDQPQDNYAYDETGNLTKDSSEGLYAIKWSVYGKPLEISRVPVTGSTLQKISYSYDAAGNRIGKVLEYSSTSMKYYTWYSRDAQGNLLCIYTANGVSPVSMPINGNKWLVYGSSRLGTFNYQVGLNGGAGRLSFNKISYTERRGVRFYELYDHLGSDIVTISDKKYGVSSGGNGSLTDYFRPDVMGAQQYYPFGSRMPSRLLNPATGAFIFGFNGKEKDQEIKGEWNSYDYGNRFYDPRVGRFLSVDPLTKKYPYYTPYQFAGNSPIKFIDLDGLEPANPDQNDYKDKTWAIDKPFNWTGGDTKYAQTVQKPLGNYAAEVDQSKFFGNPTKDPLRRTINTTSQFNLTNENAFKTEGDLVNKLLGDFIWGKGSENIVFPHNGKFATILKNSSAVGNALFRWAHNNYKDGRYDFRMGLSDEVEVDSRSGLTSLEHFLGSVAVKITRMDADKIRAEIFNVTSFTSGNYGKEFGASNPASTLRKDGNIRQPTYSNTSQYFSFDLSNAEADKLIDAQVGDAGPHTKVK